MNEWTATPEEIREGKTTDVYFLRTIQCLDKDGFDKTRVWAEATTGGIPREGKRLVFLGLNDVLNLFIEAKLQVDVYAIEEGTVLPFKDYYGVKIPFLTVDGAYRKFAKYETPMLGLLCFQSGVGTSALRLRIAAQEKTLLSFGIRRMPPAIAPTIDRACYVAGFDGISCVLSAEKLGIPATGTVPHSLIMIEGGIQPTVVSFDTNIDSSVPRIALADTFNDERVEVLDALEAIGEKLEGVRLDTPSSRKGNMREIIQEIKWELKLRDREDIKIFLSGGLTETSILEFRDIVDGFGIGTYVANSPTIDFAFDIVNIEGEDIAKRGKFAGKKQVGYCKKCDLYLCEQFEKEKILCPSCNNEMDKMLKKFIENGQLITELPTEKDIQNYIQNQRDIIKEI
ncbi:MAG: nicotinate phosphoribosyltransferase [Candidatus Heimdallarchaeaceae archaeon]